MHRQRAFRVWMVVALGIAICGVSAQSEARSHSPYSVLHFGAKGNGVAKDTRAVQKAIDRCAASGGGTVFFPAGTYLCGSIHMKTGVTLDLDAGATILGSKDGRDYDPVEKLGFKNDADRETSFFHYALIWGEGVNHIGIIGEGTIDSNRTARGGPKAIALKRCKFVNIRGIRILNIPNYTISMLGTDYVDIEGVTILHALADGIDPDSCQNLRIANCHIESADDSIVLKTSFSLDKRRATKNVTVTNCCLRTVCNAFKMGTESGGDFKRIAVSNCVMTGLPGKGPAGSGVALESVDGAHVDGVVVTNCTMVNVQAPIFVRLGNRGRDMATPIPGSLKNVAISNIVATRASLTCSITGIPGHNVEGLTLSNIRISYYGGGKYRGPDEAVPEDVKGYPDEDMFDGLQGYGMYIRHVSDLTLTNVSLSFKDGYFRLPTDSNYKVKWTTPDGVPQPSAPGRPGPALVCDDVSHLNLDGFAGRATSKDPLIRFIDVKDALVRGCMAPRGTNVFLELAGKDTRRIYLRGDILDRAKTAVARDPGVDSRYVSVDGVNPGRRK